MMEDKEILNKCLEFLRKSSNRYNVEINKQIDDLEAYNGNFWSETVKKRYLRANKRKFCLHFSDWSVLANAVVSPTSTSPWHISIQDNIDDLQEFINSFEADTDMKCEIKKAFTRAVICGAGYIVISTDIDQISGLPKIILEFVHRQGSVALDPCIEKVDASDAEEGAIVNYINLNKAKRLYGADIVPTYYPQSLPTMDFTGIDQFPNKEDMIQIISYYRKNENGFVDFYKICGDKIVQSAELPIKYIPIVRFAGYEKYGSNTSYGGIVDKTWNLQLGLNIAYSTLMERANRSIKANILASTKAVKDLNQYYEKKEDEDGSMMLYNEGSEKPQVITEQFQTGDLTQVIQNTRELIADTIGIPLAGILGSEDKTATEILIQNNNKQSNVAIFYDNAYIANRMIGRIVIEMTCDGQDFNFALENGPDVITDKLKHRQELSAVAQLMPQELQPLVAVKMCDTIDSDFIDGLRNDLIANLPNEMKIVSDTPQDPVAIHELNRMQGVLDNTMQSLEMLQNENRKLKEQLSQLGLAVNNKQDNIQLGLLKELDNHQVQKKKLEIEQAKLGVESEDKDFKHTMEITDKLANLEEKKLQNNLNRFGGR